MPTRKENAVDKWKRNTRMCILHDDYFTESNEKAQDGHNSFSKLIDNLKYVDNIDEKNKERMTNDVISLNI